MIVLRKGRAAINRLRFLNRSDELSRLRNALRSEGSLLLVLYGRRRLGKSRLIQEAHDRSKDCYFLADLRDAAIQRRAIAASIARLIPHFDEVLFPDWSALFETWIDRAPAGSTLMIDEFPYLAQLSPELPSILQRLLDTSNRPFRILLCGSSQRMVHGLVLDRAAPLYGRAAEILKVDPLSPRWLPEALTIDHEQAVEAYAVWGGSPRNWELASQFHDRDAATISLILDKNGVLHSEPPRLLLDDLRSAVQASSILSLIANGVHRQSEIAARVEKPATAIARPLALLVDLGYVRRELPFGESLRSTKRSLYRLADPFCAFWYRYVAPNESLLELGLLDEVSARIRTSFSEHVGEIWEELARRSVPHLSIDGIAWGPASRWWGTDLSGAPVELDIVALSLDRKELLIGEAKWSNRVDVRRLAAELRRRSAHLPFAGGRTRHYALWLKRPEGATASAPGGTHDAVTIIDPRLTLDSL